ncbi:hypothetical protein O181_029764 [Austropuccinia psidii MF-1]|uniref:Reverse transcriptase Ty1/copia-type domain-containing protein n=1 Tax=Austropuccinia psidii MF-1 TaxID=1389203 RepID=A0A9Q3CRI2_9BASI|nr:hypothetical protein [Austropuccinia psidii MF-1]
MPQLVSYTIVYQTPNACIPRHTSGCLVKLGQFQHSTHLGQRRSTMSPPFIRVTSCDLGGDRQIQSASVVFPRFQSSNNTPAGCVKGSLSHIFNATTLGQVPTERYFENEIKAIDTLPVTKDIAIPENLGQAFSGPLQHEWKRECKDELEQITLRDVWEAVDKEKPMKTIRHCWLFNIKHLVDGTIEKFKACFVAQGDRQRPGVDCTKHISHVTQTCLGSCHVQKLDSIIF